MQLSKHIAPFMSIFLPMLVATFVGLTCFKIGEASGQNEQYNEDFEFMNRCAVEYRKVVQYNELLQSKFDLMSPLLDSIDGESSKFHGVTKIKTAMDGGSEDGGQ